MKNLKLLLLPIISTFLCSCSTTYLATYYIGLSKVESPADAKQQFGEVKIVDYTDSINKQTYEDDYIKIVWNVDSRYFNFKLTNKTQNTLKINWDDVSYVDINGKAGRVMHSNVRYVDRNRGQAPTSIPKGAILSDYLLPTNNVYYRKYSSDSEIQGKWIEANLFPTYYDTKEEMLAGVPFYVDKKMIITMPIIIENVQNDYTFIFNIDKFKSYYYY